MDDTSDILDITAIMIQVEILKILKFTKSPDFSFPLKKRSDDSRHPGFQPHDS